MRIVEKIRTNETTLKVLDDTNVKQSMIIMRALSISLHEDLKLMST